ncbi:MAG: hypothetical protein ACREOJ_17175 [Gemmatimonadaceae bacterium]
MHILLVAGGALLAASAGAQVVKRNAATLPFQAGVIAIDVRSDAHVVIGGATGDSTEVVVLRRLDARQWADSISHLLRLHPRASASERVFRATVTDSASGAGVTFSRHVLGKTSSYRLYFANARYGGFRFDLEATEARLFLEKLNLGVRLSRTLSRPVRPPPAKRTPPR